MDSFNFVAMEPDTTFYSGGLSGKNRIIVLAETGKQYTIYRMGGKQMNPEFNLPEGNCKLEWMNPLNGKTEKKEIISHSGGKLELKSPQNKEDIALKILQK